jgi:histidinol-phosphate phosphatase family protein
MSNSVIACIIAGGKGTRIQSVSAEIPKALMPIGGIPVAEHQIRLLQRHGVNEVYFFTGHLGEKIEEYFGDGSRWGLRIGYFREWAPLGSAGCLSQGRNVLHGDLLIFSGDVMLEMDLSRLVAYHRQNKAGLTLTAHPNDHPHDSDLMELDGEGRVQALHLKPHPAGQFYQNLVNASVFVLDSRLVQLIPPERFYQFEKEFIPDLRRQKTPIYGYRTPEYIKDMGTPERLAAVERDFTSGKISRCSRAQSRPAVFLDRDGTINRHIGFLSKTEQMELLPGSAAGIRQLNRAGYLCLVVTNQPVIARGETTVPGLGEIHNKMETLLGREGAYLDAIYYCPHHPEKGFPGEVAELKIDCNCRKPKTGLIEQAVKEFNVDLAQSWLVGDTKRDEQSAQNAGLRYIQVGREAGDLSAAAGIILGK